MLQNDILHQTSCVDIPHNGVAERKNRHLLETARALLFQMHVPKHFWVDVVSTARFLINQMSSSVLDWVTPFQTLFPHKPFFPIEPRVFGCTHYVLDVRPHVSKLDPKSLKCISLVTLKFRRGIGVIGLFFRGTWFLLMSPFLRMPLFSPDPIHTSQGEDDDLLVYTLASPALAFVPPLTKSPITQVYLHPLVSSPPSAASTSDPVLSDDLPIALHKGKR